MVAVKRITQQELETYLWGAAVLLRGLIDAGDYKGYIFPLVFLKRISDVWDEEHAAALANYDGDEALAALPENHRFAIPDGAHWSDVRGTTTNVGAKILQAMRSIEAANPGGLTGVFGDGEWGNKDLLSDRTLNGLVEHFSSRTLSIAALPEDELGNGYEYLIKRFADDSGHTAQEFYTNRTLVHLMAQMLKPLPGESVYDPTCGTGGMLISCVDQVRRNGQEHRSLKLFGQERNYTTASIAQMNCFLHGIDDANIAQGDTLGDPRFLDRNGSLRQFDIVLANPPYSISNWNRAGFAKDPFGRNMWGVPPQGRADYAFFQHIASSMNPETGRAAILFPHGVLFRQEEKEQRRRLIASGMLESVIGLGPGLFYNAPMEAVVITLRARPKPERRGKVLFVNAVDLHTRERAQSYLRESDQSTILDAYEGFASRPGFATVVGVRDIAANDHSLAISLYVQQTRHNAKQRDGAMSEDVSEWRSAAAQTDDVLSGLLRAFRGASK